MASPLGDPATRAVLTDPAAWRAVAPDLTITAEGGAIGTPPFDIDEASADALGFLIRSQGYLHLPPVDWGLPIATMAEALGALRKLGLSPTFGYLFDEFWAMFAKLDPMLVSLLGPDYRALPDFWAWYVDPDSGESGWSPHRDRGRATLRDDGGPNSLTVWLPLTDATPLNSCMYVVPADRDPTYGTDEEQDFRFAFADIRALPAPAGSILAWNQALAHWGSHATPLAAGPRLSISFEFQRGDIEPLSRPLTRPRTLPPFAMRLRLVCMQLLQYKHMYPLDPALEAVARDVLMTETR